MNFRCTSIYRKLRLWLILWALFLSSQSTFATDSFHQSIEYPNYLLPAYARSFTYEQLHDSHTGELEAHLQKVRELLPKAVQSIFRRIIFPVYDSTDHQVHMVPFYEHLVKKMSQVTNEGKLYLSFGMVRSCLTYIKSQLRNQATKSDHFDPLQALNEIIRNQNSLRWVDVLVWGSDFDITLDVPDDKYDEVSTVLIETINSIESELELRDFESSIKRALMPIADIKKYTNENSEAVLQGGSTLDFLAFDTKNGNFLQPVEHPEIVDDFILGFYDYVAAIDTSKIRNPAKQLIRGFRPTLEDPSLRLKSKTIIARELQQQVEALNRGSLPDNNALEQFAKMIRNGEASGANNRFLRSKEGSLENKFYVWSMRLSQQTQLTTIPEFVEFHSLYDEKPAIQDWLINSLVNTDRFIDEFTGGVLNREGEKGFLYHGTPHLNNILSIIRVGLFKSRSQAIWSTTGAVYGDGGYMHPNPEFSEQYQGDDGAIIGFKISENIERARVLNWSALQEEALKNPIIRKKLAEKENQAKSEGIHIFDLLAREDGVDIIVHGDNSHPVIVLNMAVLEPPQRLSGVVEAYISSYRNQASYLNTRIDAYHVARRIRVYAESLAESGLSEIETSTSFASMILTEATRMAIDEKAALLRRLDALGALKRISFNGEQNIRRDYSRLRQNLLKVFLRKGTAYKTLSYKEKDFVRLLIQQEMDNVVVPSSFRRGVDFVEALFSSEWFFQLSLRHRHQIGEYFLKHPPRTEAARQALTNPTASHSDFSFHRAAYNLLPNDAARADYLITALKHCYFDSICEQLQQHLKTLNKKVPRYISQKLNEAIDATSSDDNLYWKLNEILMTVSPEQSRRLNLRNKLLDKLNDKQAAFQEKIWAGYRLILYFKEKNLRVLKTYSLLLTQKIKDPNLATDFGQGQVVNSVEAIDRIAGKRASWQNFYRQLLINSDNEQVRAIAVRYFVNFNKIPDEEIFKNLILAAKENIRLSSFGYYSKSETISMSQLEPLTEKIVRLLRSSPYSKGNEQQIIHELSGHLEDGGGQVEWLKWVKEAKLANPETLDHVRRSLMEDSYSIHKRLIALEALAAIKDKDDYDFLIAKSIEALSVMMKADYMQHEYRAAYHRWIEVMTQLNQIKKIGESSKESVRKIMDKLDYFNYQGWTEFNDWEYFEKSRSFDFLSDSLAISWSLTFVWRTSKVMDAPVRSEHYKKFVAYKNLAQQAREFANGLLRDQVGPMIWFFSRIANPQVDSQIARLNAQWAKGIIKNYILKHPEVFIEDWVKDIDQINQSILVPLIWMAGWIKEVNPVADKFLKELRERKRKMDQQKAQEAQRGQNIFDSLYSSSTNYFTQSGPPYSALREAKRISSGRGTSDIIGCSEAIEQ